MTRCTPAGGALSTAPAQRCCRRARVAWAVAKGRWKPAMPLAFQAMPQLPIGESKRANAWADMVRTVHLTGHPVKWGGG